MSQESTLFCDEKRGTFNSISLQKVSPTSQTVILQAVPWMKSPIAGKAAADLWAPIWETITVVVALKTSKNHMLVTSLFFWLENWIY